MSYLSTAWGTSSWVDSSELVWVITTPSGASTTTTLNQIYSDDAYVYAATLSGVSIINLQSEVVICYAIYPSGFNSVVGNSEYVYLGTNSSGVFYFPKSAVSGTELFPGDISQLVHPFTATYSPSCSEIVSLAIYNYDLAVVTTEGLDIIGMAPGKEFKSSTTSSGITKSFLTSKKEIYYIENSGIWSLNKVTPYLCDWEVPTIKYSVGDSFLIVGVDLNDLFITENTSLNNIDNTVFMATTSGIYIYDEGITDVVDIYIHN